MEQAQCGLVFKQLVKPCHLIGGVPIRASSLLHYCDAFAARVGGPEALANMRMASATTLAADLGNTMVFPSRLFGGELHLMPLETSRDPQLFLEYASE